MRLNSPRIWSILRTLLVFLPISSAIFTRGLSANNCSCERRFRPVCGSDGVTYDSECHLHCTKNHHKPDLRLIYSGTCCPKNSCPSLISPVCDNFGRTHQNECRFHYHKCLVKKLQNKKLFIQHMGECRADERQNEDCTKLFCDLETDGPMCDEIGNTHNSTCKFDELNCERRNKGQAEISLSHHGRCRNETEIREKEMEIVIAMLNFNSSTEMPVKSHKKSKKKLNKLKGRTEKDRKVSDRKALASKTRPQSSKGPEIPELESTNQKEKMNEEETTSDEPFSTVSNPFFLQEFIEKERFPEPSPMQTTTTTQRTTTKMEILLQTTTPVLTMTPWDLSKPCSAVSCKKTWHPVCDHQGRTHKNPCLFDFFACKVYRHDGIILEIAHNGECKDTQVYRGDDEPCGVCSTTKEKTPVCDNRNQTHPSLCHLSVWNCQMERKGGDRRVLVHIGSCHRESPIFTEEEEICPEKCSKEMRPVCDEEMAEHQNLCTYQQRNCIERKAGRRPPSLARLSACPKESGSKKSKEIIDCPTPRCSNESDPICDLTGTLHLNECYFEHARCKAARKGIKLEITGTAKCETCQLECPSDKRPICANDYMTYENECHFKRAKCMNESLTVLFRGSCSLCLNEPCPILDKHADESLLVCDQNGQTRSRCEFNMLHCVLSQNFGFNLSVVHEGRCCASPDNCASAPKNPICGSDELTYENICLFEIARCQKMKRLGIELLMLNDGPCGDHPKKVIQRASEEANHEKGDTENCEGFLKCSHEYEPICGTDNRTYTNPCQFKEAKCKSKSLEINYLGECCEFECPPNWGPICDSDGKSHQNLCFFGLARCLEQRRFRRNLTISSFELCEKDHQCEMCSKIYEPVCANNEETFVNQCELDKYNCLIEKRVSGAKKIAKAYDGKCCSRGGCSLTYEPLCDSNGRTHPNKCSFLETECKMRRLENTSLQIAYHGQCCNQPCEESYRPICDGRKTHSNMCTFRVAQCEAERQGDVLLLAYAGECCKMEQRDCQKSGHLCDSDGQTHVDLCHFKEKQCIMERNRLKNITVVHTGECCKIEPCDKKVAPVCDSNGGTHASMCHFKNTKCIHDKLHPNNTLHFEYDGPCCASNCPGEWDPVCDQHGRVYKNNCFFQLKSCELRKRSGGVLLETPCPDRRTRSYNLPTLHNQHNFPVGSRIYHV